MICLYAAYNGFYHHSWEALPFEAGLGVERNRNWRRPDASDLGGYPMAGAQMAS